MLPRSVGRLILSKPLALDVLVMGNVDRAGAHDAVGPDEELNSSGLNKYKRHLLTLLLCSIHESRHVVFDAPGP